jgi:uncharacterized protein (TIGR02145 family)
MPTGESWEAANDPSPAGWRVPTLTEGQTLLDATKVSYEWTTQNGVLGGKFTDKASGQSLFLPAVGVRNDDSGLLQDEDEVGVYWVSTAQNGTRAYNLFVEIGGDVGGDSRSFGYGFSVRSVAK